MKQILLMPPQAIVFEGLYIFLCNKQITKAAFPKGYQKPFCKISRKDVEYSLRKKQVESLEFR